MHFFLGNRKLVKADEDSAAEGLEGLAKAVDSGMSAGGIESSMIYGSGSAISALNLCRTRRVESVLLSDSNGSHSGYGWQRMFFNAFKDAGIPFFATPIMLQSNLLSKTGPIDESDSNSYMYGVTGSWDETVDDDYNLFPHTIYTSSGETGVNLPVVIPRGLGFDVDSKLRLHVGYTGDGATSAVNILFRLEYSPYSTLATSSISAAETGYNVATLDLAEGIFDSDGTKISAGIASNQTITGPFGLHFSRIEDVTEDTGICFSALYSTPGDSMYDFASGIASFTDEQLQNYFSETRRLQLIQGQEPKVVVIINSGLNDRNETSTPTLGAGEFDSSSSAIGYIDNLKAVTTKIRKVWDDKGWNSNELHFLCIASHVVPDDESDLLNEYRDALKEFSEKTSNVTTIDMRTRMDAVEAEASGWYYKDGDDTEYAHLSDIIGYKAVSNLIFKDVL